MTITSIADIFDKKINLKNGSNRIESPLNLEDGFYYLKINSPTFSESKAIVFLNLN